MSARPALKFKPRRSNVFRAIRQVSGNSEWFKKLDPGAQIQPCRSLRGPEAESTTSSRYSSFQGHERSLDPGRLRRALGTREQTKFRPSAYVDLQPLGLTWGEEKSNSPFVSTPRPRQWWAKYASLSASQWLSRSSISRPPFCVRWMQTCLWNIGPRPPQSNLEKDRWSRGSTANR